MTKLVEFEQELDQADASVSLWMRNQYECALGLTYNHKHCPEV